MLINRQVTEVWKQAGSCKAHRAVHAADRRMLTGVEQLEAKITELEEET